MTRFAIHLGSIAAAAAVAAAVSSVSAPHPERVRRLVAPPAATLAHRTPIGALGGGVRRLVGRPPDLTADRRVGWLTVLTVVLVMAVPPVGLLVAAVAPVVALVRRRRRVARARQALVDELPEVIDLLRLTVAAGYTVPLAVATVADRGCGRLAEELRRAHRASTLGAPLSDALEQVTARLGDPVRPLVGVLIGSLRDGTPGSPALERVADEVRMLRRRAAEERARQVSVRLLFPLVCCVLPAFALLTVVPLLAGALRGLSF